MYETTQMIILEYIADLKEPRRNWRRSDFADRVYSRWAAREILYYVQKNRDIPPGAAIEEFIDIVERYSKRDFRAAIIFTNAKKVAEDILDILTATRE